MSSSSTKNAGRKEGGTTSWEHCGLESLISLRTGDILLYRTNDLGKQEKDRPKARKNHACHNRTNPYFFVTDDYCKQVLRSMRSSKDRCTVMSRWSSVRIRSY